MHPKDQAALERQYLGAIITRPELYWANQVQPADLVSTAHRDIVDAVSALLRAGKTVDMVSVSEESGQPLDQVGQMCLATVSATAGVSAAAAIQAAARKRRTLTALKAAATSLEDGETDPVTALSSVLDTMHQRTDDTVTVAEAIREEEEAYRNRRKGGARVRTPIPTLNSMLPIEGPKMICIGGRPGNYKSALAACILRATGMNGVPCGIISLEMDARELAGRFKRMAKGGGFPLSDYDKMPLYISHKTFALGDIEGRVVEWRERHGVEVVVIDHLQLVTLDMPGAKQMAKLTEITRRIKLLAMRLDMPIIVLSQLNRELEKENRAPRLADLRESGSIEQDSDVVMFMHRDKNDNWELHLAKHRGGPKGIIDLQVDGPHYRVQELIGRKPIASSRPATMAGDFTYGGEHDTVAA